MNNAILSPTKRSFSFGNKVLAGCLAFLLVGLVGCGSQDAESEKPLIGGATSDTTAKPSAGQPNANTPRSNTSGSNTSGGVQATPPPQPPVAPPPPVFQPGLDDVRFAFTTAFLNTYSKMQKTPAVEKWALGEQQKIVAMKVQSCSTSTVGTASVCRVRFNNIDANIKVMLTQSGWVLTQ